jgi:C1A family cysteine protease
MATQIIDVTDSQDGKGLPDVEDERDWHYADHRSSLPAIERKDECDLRGGCAAVQKQRGDLSCVAHAVVSAIEFLETKDANRACEQFSRYFVYYNARLLDQDTPHVVDIGTSVRCAIKGVRRMGVCAETVWPYVPENLERIPHEASYGSARLHHLVKYYRLQNDTMDELRDCLGRGFPFVFLMRYGDDYQKRAGDRKDGHVWLPRKDEIGDPESLPTHSVMAVGYNDKTERLTFMNSKGRGWGDNGFGQLDYEYVTEHGLCRDFWTIRKVEDVGAAAIVKNK